MICDFSAFPTVFQSYQVDGRMMMKGDGTPFMTEKNPISRGARTRDSKISRPAHNLPGSLGNWYSFAIVNQTNLSGSFRTSRCYADKCQSLCYSRLADWFHQIQLGQSMLKIILLHFLPPTPSPFPTPHHVHRKTHFRALSSPGHRASIIKGIRALIC